MVQKIPDENWASLEMIQKGVAQGSIHGIAQGIEHGLAQGIKLGLEEGRREGRLEALRPVLVRLVEARFPQVTFMARQQALRVKDPEVLKILVERVIAAKSGGDVTRLFLAVARMTGTIS